MKTIYGLYDPSGELRYIGQTMKSPEHRLARHIWHARSGGRTHIAKWLLSINCAATVRTLAVVPLEEANEVERRTIADALANGARLTNIRAGGEGGGGFSLTEEQRAKIAESNRRRFADPAAREKMRESTRALHAAGVIKPHPMSDENKRILVASNRKPKSDATRAAMRDAALRRISTPKGRAALIARQPKGPLSSDHKAKLSRATKGLPKSPETRIRMVDAWKLRRAS